MADRKVTLFYRAESARGVVTITTDRLHAERSGTIKRIYRSKKQAIPPLTVCTVPKGTAPWEISSELEPLVFQNTEKDISLQLTDMGRLGDILLEYFEDGNGWDSEIVIVPAAMVPKREAACDSDEKEDSQEAG
jgi:hypothetical protein